MCIYATSHQISYFKYVLFIISEIYLNKAEQKVKKKKEEEVTIKLSPPALGKNRMHLDKVHISGPTVCVEAIRVL